MRNQFFSFHHPDMELSLSSHGWALDFFMHGWSSSENMAMVLRRYPSTNNKPLLAAMRSVDITELELANQTMHLVSDGDHDARQILGGWGIKEINPPARRKWRLRA